MPLYTIFHDTEMPLRWRVAGVLHGVADESSTCHQVVAFMQMKRRRSGAATPNTTSYPICFLFTFTFFFQSLLTDEFSDS